MTKPLCMRCFAVEVAPAGAACPACAERLVWQLRHARRGREKAAKLLAKVLRAACWVKRWRPGVWVVMAPPIFGGDRPRFLRAEAKGTAWSPGGPYAKTFRSAAEALAAHAQAPSWAPNLTDEANEADVFEGLISVDVPSLGTPGGGAG